MTSQAEATPQIPSAGIDVIEALYTTRAMRRLKPDPIPDDVLRAIMDAAIRGPSGGNSQTWYFMVVRDPQVRAELGRIYKPCLETIAQPGGPYYDAARSPDDAVRIPVQKMLKSALHLANHMQDAPVIIVPCIATGRQPGNLFTGSSIYPAVQNLMIAARAYGVGSTLTTIGNMIKGDEIRAVLKIPQGVEAAALIPLGYPTGRWGVGPRRPLEDVVFGDSFGEKLSLG